jgi:hypothetical protein
MEVRVSLCRKHDHVQDLKPAIPSTTPRRPANKNTYAEDGTNGSSLDSRPDQPLDDSVGLYKKQSPRRQSPLLTASHAQRRQLTAEPGLASAQVEEQNSPKLGNKKCAASAQHASFVSDGRECTNVMRTGGMASAGRKNNERMNSLPTIGKHGNAQPRSRDRNEDLEICSAIKKK